MTERQTDPELEWIKFKSHSISEINKKYPNEDATAFWSRLETYMDEGIVTRDTVQTLVTNIINYDPKNDQEED